MVYGLPTMPCTKANMPSPKQASKMAKLAHKYSLKYCDKVLKDNPIGALDLLSYVLRDAGLKDPDAVSATLMLGRHKGTVLSTVIIK